MERDSYGTILLTTLNLPLLPANLILQLSIGIPAVGFSVAIQTMPQTSASDRCQGRVFGALNTTSALLVLSGQELTSALGDGLGIMSLLNLSGSLCFLGAADALLMLSGTGQCGFSEYLTRS